MHHDGRHRRARAIKMAEWIGAIVVIVLVGYLVFSSGGGVRDISSATTVTLASSPSYYHIDHNTYMLQFASTSGGSAYVLVERLPIFIYSLLNVTLPLDSAVRINTEGQYADMQLKLTALNSKNATVEITPLDSSLMLQPNSNLISVSQTSLIGGTTSNSTKAITSSSTTTVTSTSTAGTTTIVTNDQRALSIAKGDEYYGLAMNYSALYNATSGCTASLYNSTYQAEYSSSPPGANSFENISAFVPYSMNSIVTLSGGDIYDVIFYSYTIDPTFNDTAALVIQVNVTSNGVVGQTLSGIYSGLSYQSMLSGYNRAKSIGGACGVDIP